MGVLRAELAPYDVVGDIRGPRPHDRRGDRASDRAGKEPAPELRERILEEAFRRGLLLLGCGKNTIRISPPLIIDHEDAEIAVRILAEAVAAAAR